MPKKEINYENTVIYKIVCNDLNVKDCYVGHTTDFIGRKSCHKRRCENLNNNLSNLKLYRTIRENGDWNNWTMVEIEKFPCNDANEARKRERYWFEELHANLNMKYPNRETNEYKKEYYENNKEEILKKQKENYENNKEEVLHRNRKWYENNNDTLLQKFECVCGGKYIFMSKLRHFKTQKHQLYLAQLQNTAV